MMIFYYTERSPYARKVLLTAYAVSVINELELVEVDFTNKPAEFLAANPIGRVPCLIDGETVYYDSVSSCVFLESKGGISRSVAETNLCSLCDGLTDVTVDWFKETLRAEEKRSGRMLAKFEETTNRTLAVLESRIGEFPIKLVPHSIALISVLGYIQLRWTEIDFAYYPKLNAWVREMNSVKGVTETAPQK